MDKKICFFAQTRHKRLVIRDLCSTPSPSVLCHSLADGHSLGAALATLLGLEVAANTTFSNPTVYTYASPRTGDPLFASTFNSVINNKFRASNRLDIVTKVPLIPSYLQMYERFIMNPTDVKLNIPCEHDLTTYLHLLSVAAGVTFLPLGPGC